MGKKGDKLTNQSSISAEELVEKLISIGSIHSKKMFGGHGIFHENKMFAIVNSKGDCYFKVNQETQSAYEEKGALKHGKMPYFSIPEEVFTNETQLIDWALESIEISKK